jgi:hypothetical protein
MANFPHKPEKLKAAKRQSVIKAETPSHCTYLHVRKIFN